MLAVGCAEKCVHSRPKCFRVITRRDDASHG
jgi:hypothetical protein